jgi:hypothetical protein
MKPRIEKNPEDMGKLTPRWKVLKFHPVQDRLIRSAARFNVVPAGRRSGKTEIVGKRKIVLCALNAHRKDLPFFYRPWPDPRFFVAAPTRDQVKRIYWEDLKAMIPKRYVYGNPNESYLMIKLLNGSEIWCLGLDRPERAEGVPWDGGVLDEYADMKKDTWARHIRPSLSDRRGWCDFIGVPEGRNHYYDLYKDAKARASYSIAHGVQPVWDTFHWTSETILSAEEIDEAKQDMDELSYAQEYNASFINFSGRAYWAFNEDSNIGRLAYNPDKPIDFCFDFNTAPGVAVVIQEQPIKQPNSNDTEWGDGIIGEVYIPHGSNTEMVCDRLAKDWAKHRSSIVCYGDFTGNQNRTAQVMGSDWTIIRNKLKWLFGKDRVTYKVKPNPRERDRVNSVNSRCKNIQGAVRLMVDPSKAPHVVKDFEGVRLVEGGSGEIDKRTNPELTHLTDAIGYRIWVKYPLNLRKDYAPSNQRFVR